MVTVLIFLLLISILILVHELGHFIAARKLGVIAEEFGLGFPPKVRKLFTWKGTDFTLNWLPIGGFVRMRGEDAINSEQKTMSNERKEGFFYAQKAWKRAVIILAGVTMNLALAIALFTMVYQAIGIPTETENVVVGGVAPESPAAAVGLRSGDIVRQFRITNYELRITETNQFVNLINEHRGEEITLLIERNGEKMDISVVPRIVEETPEGQGALGVVVSTIENVRYPWWQMPFRAAVTGTKEAIGWGITILIGLRDMVSNLIRFGRVPADVAGPIGIARLTGHVAQQGWIPLVQFAGILSVNLGILNALPIPALDGGQLAFLLIEVARRGRPVNPKTEHYIHLVGYAVLIALLVLVSVRDVLTPVSQ